MTTPPPAHHVRIEELHDVLVVCNPAFKGKVSLSNLIEIVQALNAKLDERNNGPRTETAPELPEAGNWKPSQGHGYVPRGMA